MSDYVQLTLDLFTPADLCVSYIRATLREQSIMERLLPPITVYYDPSPIQFINISLLATVDPQLELPLDVKTPN